MKRDEFEELLKHGEETWLEWKGDFPINLLKKDKGDPKWKDKWEKGKGELLKDLVSMANRDDERKGYLVYGVVDHITHREVKGITNSIDGADYQTWAENSFYPPFAISYHELQWDADKIVGIFSIGISPNYPHVAIDSIGGIIYKGQVWFRRGSKNTVALYDELCRMFRASEPFNITFGHKNGPEYQRIKDFYEKQGFELVQLPLNRRDISISEGYKIAYYPNSRREIWIEEPSSIDRYDLLMLREKNKKG